MYFNIFVENCVIIILFLFFMLFSEANDSIFPRISKYFSSHTSFSHFFNFLRIFRLRKHDFHRNNEKTKSDWGNVTLKCSIHCLWFLFVIFMNCNVVMFCRLHLQLFLSLFCFFSYVCYYLNVTYFGIWRFDMFKFIIVAQSNFNDLFNENVSSSWSLVLKCVQHTLYFHSKKKIFFLHSGTLITFLQPYVFFDYLKLTANCIFFLEIIFLFSFHVLIKTTTCITYI